MTKPNGDNGMWKVRGWNPLKSQIYVFLNNLMRTLNVKVNASEMSLECGALGGALGVW